MPEAIRCGRIKYLNDIPLYAAFDEGAVEFPGELVSGVPAYLNMELIRGNLDMGPISAAQFARHCDEFTLLDGPCIGARDYAWSVLLISPTPPHLLDGTEIAVTRESASGRALLQILLERRYGVRAGFASSDDPLYAAQMHQPALLIGDQALDARERFDPAICHDLAHLWHEWTDADMVFAVWVARNDAYQRNPKAIDAAAQALAASQSWGEEHMPQVVARANALRPRSTAFYQEYYSVLNFQLDLSARSGLARFIAELDAVGLLPGVFRSAEIVNVAS
ncbi:MAG: menaquinone biosynthesis protein [Candidatus Eremiobacteraeota bacterium]|nr:menaquinone biosynthesis protein [Candidatus Eremiobacteraeota bacterium]